MGITTIEWTRGDDGTPGRTANPIRARHRVTGKVGWHCAMISPGCAHCYAQTLNGRFGTRLPFTQRSEQDVELFLDLKPIEALRRVRKPSKVFLCDMTDIFQDAVPDEWLDQIFAMMAVLDKHTFQVLTKRSKRMREYFESRTLADVYTSVLRTSEDEPAYSPSPLDYTRGVIRLLDSWEVRDGHVSAHPLPKTWPLPNCWLGVSIEDQKRADERIPDLLGVPAAVRFLSVEPVLEAIDLGLHRVAIPKHREHWPMERVSNFWVIAGGESGPRSRPFDLAWARSLRDQCQDAGVPYFLKQCGSSPFDSDAALMVPGAQIKMSYEQAVEPENLDLLGQTIDAMKVHFRDKKGGDMDEWPDDLRIREFPVGKILEAAK